MGHIYRYTSQPARVMRSIKTGVHLYIRVPTWKYLNRNNYGVRCFMCGTSISMTWYRFAIFFFNGCSGFSFNNFQSRFVIFFVYTRCLFVTIINAILKLGDSFEFCVLENTANQNYLLLFENRELPQLCVEARNKCQPGIPSIMLSAFFNGTVSTLASICSIRSKWNVNGKRGPLDFLFRVSNRFKSNTR